MAETKCSLKLTKGNFGGASLGERLLCLLNSGKENVGDVTLVSTLDNSIRRAHRDVLEVALSLDVLQEPERGRIHFPARGKHIDLLIELLYTGKLNTIEDRDIFPLYIACQSLKLYEAVEQLEVFIKVYLRRCFSNAAFLDLTFDELSSLVPILADEDCSQDERRESVKKIFEWTSQNSATNLSLTFNICQKILDSKSPVDKLLLVYKITDTVQELYRIVDVEKAELQENEDEAIVATVTLEDGCVIEGMVDGKLIVHRQECGPPDSDWRLNGEGTAVQHERITFLGQDGTVVRSVRSSTFHGMVVFKGRIFIWTQRDIFVMQATGWHLVAHLDVKIQGRVIIQSYNKGNLSFAFQSEYGPLISYMAHATERGVDCVRINAIPLGVFKDELLVQTNDNLLATIDSSERVRSLGPLGYDTHPHSFEAWQGNLYGLRRTGPANLQVYKFGIPYVWTGMKLLVPRDAYFIGSTATRS